MFAILTFAAPVIFALTPQADAQTAAAPTACQKFNLELTKSGEGSSAKKLNELPNANVVLAVIRRDPNGCFNPVIVRYDVGSAPRKR